MNHMELSPGTVMGVALVTAGILLYALRTREPRVSRGVICKCIQKKDFRHIYKKLFI